MIDIPKDPPYFFFKKNREKERESPSTGSSRHGEKQASL